MIASCAEKLHSQQDRSQQRVWEHSDRRAKAGIQVQECNLHIRRDTDQKGHASSWTLKIACGLLRGRDFQVGCQGQILVWIRQHPCRKRHRHRLLSNRDILRSSRSCCQIDHGDGSKIYFRGESRKNPKQNSSLASAQRLASSAERTASPISAVDTGSTPS